MWKNRGSNAALSSTLLTEPYMRAITRTRPEKSICSKLVVRAQRWAGRKLEVERHAQLGTR